jgi:hypothetical protein
MRRLFNLQSLMAMLAVLLITFGSCRKEEFDQPPSNGIDPALAVNMTLDSLKKIYFNDMTVAKKNIIIQNDWTVKGMVVADDKSGNLYKTVVIDDGTAGISVRIDISNYNTDYPVGRQVYIKLQGLAMGPYAGLVQLGGYIDSTSGSSPTVEAIPASLVVKYLVPGTWGNTVTPHVVTIPQLGNTYQWQSRLITVQNIQFQTSDTAEKWADNIALASVNRYLEDCYNNELIVRTSGYSNFAGQLTPSGSGSITGVFGVYNSDKQLTIRDLNDVNMQSPRFVIGSCPPPPSVLSSIADIRNEFAQGASVCPDVYIEGVVISDYTTANINGKNLYIQDNSGGIVVRFAANHSFALGDSLTIQCSGQTLSEFNGLLQIGGSFPNVPNAYATKVGTGTVVPRIATITQLKANLTGTNDPWESTLVELQNVTIQGGGTYSGSKIVTDGIDSITIFTSSAATFSGANVPTGPVTITAILSDYSFSVAPYTRQQLVLRNSTDVQ